MPLNETEVVKEVEGRLRADLGMLMPWLASLDAISRTTATDPAVAREMRDAGLQGLTDLTRDQMDGGALAKRHGPAIARYFLRVIEHEDHGRDHLGLPPKTPAAAPQPGPATDGAVLALLQAIAAKQAETEAQLSALAGQTKAAKHEGPLFSAAAESYIAKLAKTHSEGYEEIRYLRHRKAIFLTLCEDKPVAAYTRADLQHFVDEVRYLPPNISKQKGYDIKQIGEYIAAAKQAGAPGLAANTLQDTYLSRIRTILRDGCADAGIPFPLQDVSVRMPHDAPKARRRLALDNEKLANVFRMGVESGSMAEAMMPLLGYLTGRRIGLLTYLRREDIHRHHGAWLITPRQAVLKDGRWQVVPLKTEESLTAFVLHNFLDDIGFIDWARAAPGFVFESLHAAGDPADTASKRMGRHFRKAGVDPQYFAMFHGLRHAKINRDRELKIAPRASRLQVGHELRGVHESYGEVGMNATETISIAQAELSPDLDLSMFRGIDFDALGAFRPKTGRPQKQA